MTWESPQPTSPQPSGLRTFSVGGKVIHCDWAAVRPIPQGEVVQVMNDGGQIAVWSTTGAAQQLLSQVDSAGTLARVEESSEVRCERPTWATVLGIVGLVLTLIGGLFLLVKEDKVYPISVLELRTPDGRVLALQMSDPAATLRAGIGAS